ncbi:MAG: cytochrome c biogenesis protein CcdA [Bacteroidota bacterium]
MSIRSTSYLFLLFLTLVTSCEAVAQILTPAIWQVSWSDEDAKAGEEVDLVFTVTIDQDWYLYSSDFDPDLGPMVTEFTFEPGDGYELVGEIKPIGAKEKYDELWEGNYTYFTEKAEFRQTVKVLDKNPGKISGSYSYQVCTDVDGRCIPFDDEFTLAAPLGGKAESSVEQSDVEEKLVTSANTNSRESTTPYTLITFFFIAFLAGLAALLTPCVFPMIPMTVTFFTGGNSSNATAIRKAIIYGLSIVAIYTVVGTLVSVIFGPAFANWLSTHWLPNLFFFAVFIFFALSFLGLFEITLPSSLVNKVDQQADKGGYYGIFFMAFTLVLVSFSCTGPIVGSVLVESAGGQFVKPIVGMLGFSLAFAIPFALFAAFPQWLNSLPKSGGWLNSVKVILGFLELALALKFLSVADQVYHWNLLDREVYLTLWIVIFALMGFYLLGKLRLPHDSKLETISVPRLMLAIATFSFVVYLIPGLFGAPLKALAGYLPPMHTHDFNMPLLIAQQQSADGGSALVRNEVALCDEPKHSDLLHFPHGIQGYFDYDQALACAHAQNKPLFIDFTGHGCVNCREMEARVWSDPAVLQRLKEDFVMVALYVDEKAELPESAWYTSDYDNKVKKTIGKQNADLQIRRFNNNAQPYYVLLNSQGELLAEPKAYDLSVTNFVDFLELGKQRFAAGETIEDPTLARK